MDILGLFQFVQRLKPSVGKLFLFHDGCEEADRYESALLDSEVQVGPLSAKAVERVNVTNIADLKSQLERVQSTSDQALTGFVLMPSFKCLTQSEAEV